MWGYPLWSFAPLALLMWLKPVADTQALRRFAVAFIAVFVAFPIIYVATEIGEPLVRDRPKATQFPGRALAEIVTRDWHNRYGTPVTYVGGSEFVANNVAVYSLDRPHVVVHGELKLSPWVDVGDLRRRGAVLVWEEGQQGGNLDQLRATFGDLEVQPVLILAPQTWFRGPTEASRLRYCSAATLIGKAPLTADPRSQGGFGPFANAPPRILIRLVGNRHHRAHARLATIAHAILANLVGEHDGRDLGGPPRQQRCDPRPMLGAMDFGIARGQCGSLLLHRDGLPPSTSCRSPGAPVHSITCGHHTGGSLTGTKHCSTN